MKMNYRDSFWGVYFICFGSLFSTTGDSMRFLIILAAALAVARAGSYGGGHGYGGGGGGRWHGGFNAHQFDVPVETNFGGIGGGIGAIGGGIGAIGGGIGGGFGGSIGYRGGAVGGGAGLGMVGGGFNAHQFDVPVRTASIGYDTDFGGVGLGAGSLTAGGGGGIFDTAIAGDVQYVDGGFAGGFDGGYVGGGLTNARIVDTDLGFVDYDGQFDDVYGGMDYGYGYGGASLGPGAAVTVLTNRRRGPFGSFLDRITGPRYELEQGYVIGPGGGYNDGFGYGGVGGNIGFGGAGFGGVNAGYYDDDYFVGGAGLVPVSPPIPIGGMGGGVYPVGGVGIGGVGGGVYPVGAGGFGGGIVAGGYPVPVGAGYSYMYGGGPGVAAGNLVGGAVNAVGNVAAGTANVVGNIANTALGAAGSFATGAVQGVQQGVNALGRK